MKPADYLMFLLAWKDVDVGTAACALPIMALHAAEKVHLVSKQVAECLDGKGGGRSGRYQGKAPHITQAQVQDAVKRMSLVTATG